MSTLHDIEGVPTLYTKGAIDVLLDRSDYVSPPPVRFP